MTLSPANSLARDNSDDLFADAQSAGLPPMEGAKEKETYAPVDQKVMDACGKNPAQLMTLVRQIESQSSMYMTATTKASWERSYKAYRSEHFQGSKYTSTRFRQRSKIFRPKTRSAVRKNQASAAAALFATVDAVQITAQDTGDTKQLAAAALNHEILNYRLDRSSGRNAIPWFLTAMGCHQSAQITGICASIQTWAFKERDGKKILDRPDCIDIPPENLLLDPNADWRNPAQASGYLTIRWPLPIWEVKEKMKGEDGTSWLELSDEELDGLASTTPQDNSGVRRAREGGSDKETYTTNGPYRVVWCFQNFLRIDGEDYMFWSLGKERLLSIPQKVAELYAHLGGERPVVVGYGAIEAHKVLPMSPVESWQQLQQEANDVTNLRLDQMKHVVNPIAKVKRGRQVDIEQLQRRGPDGVLMLQDIEDVMWDRPPDVPPSAYQEGNYINADIDELAGSFSVSSVQSNRNLNETVGGMKMISGAAGSVTEFDLRVWIETWVEPVMWQLLRLIQFYEDDETVLAIAGEKAQLFDKYGVEEVTEEILMADVTLRVGVGLGNSDPMQGLQKIGAAAEIAGKILEPFMMAGKSDIRPNTKEIVNEIFGKAGYKDAGDRFFYIGDESQPPQPPQQGDDGKAAAAAATAQIKAAEIEAKMADSKEERQAKYADKAEERSLKVQLQEMQAKSSQQDKLIDIVIKAMAEREQTQIEHELQKEAAGMDRSFMQQDKAEERQFSEKDQRRQRMQSIMDREREERFRSRELDIAEKGIDVKAKAKPNV